MDKGIKTSEFGVTGAAGVAAILPIVLGSIPQEQVWIAVVAGASVAIAYVVCRTVLKMRGL